MNAPVRRGGHPRAVAILVSLVLLVTALVGVELLLRATDPRGQAVHGDRRWSSEAYPDKVRSRQATADLHDFRMEDAPYVGYRPVPDQHFATLNIGHARARGADIGPKRPGALRVIVLGGSFAFGVGATADDRTVPAVLEDALRRDLPGRDVEVLNLAVPGYVVTQQLIDLMARGLALGPDLVVFLDGLNDVYVSAGGQPGEPLLNSSANWRFGLLEWALGSALAERVLTIAREARGPAPLAPLPGVTLAEMARRGAAVYADRVREAAAVSAAHGVVFLHFVQPSLVGGRKVLSAEEHRLVAAADGCSDIAVGFCRSGLAAYLGLATAELASASRALAASGVPSRDLNGVFDDVAETRWLDLAHLSDAGYAAVASAMLPAVRGALARR